LACQPLQASPLLGALGQGRVALHHKQHVLLGIGVAHFKSDVEGFAFASLATAQATA